MKKYDTLIFDLDGTLAVSKSALGNEMATLLGQATHYINIVIITGGTFDQILNQVVTMLPASTDLNNLYVLPTSGSSMKSYNKITHSWDSVYENKLSLEQKETIIVSLKRGLEKTSFTINPDTLVGEQIEDRGTQISFSALGQEQPIDIKKLWDPDRKKRLELMSFLQPLDKDFNVKIGGTTTIDITLKGIDKAFGIFEFYKHIGLNIENGLFIGDQIIPEGNDFAATKTGINMQHTTGPEETINIIKEALRFHDLFMIK
jgi:hypothetical protein